MFQPECVIAECKFSAVRSGGKGGQNVNKVSTKVVLQFDVFGSLCLTDAEKELIINNLSNKISDKGILIITASAGRSQADNRKVAENKLIQLLLKALKVPKVRVETKLPSSAKENRLADKKAISDKKAARSQQWDTEPNL